MAAIAPASSAGKLLLKNVARKSKEAPRWAGRGHPPAVQHVLQPQRVLRENARIIADQCALQIVEVVEHVLPAGLSATLAEPFQFLGISRIDGVGREIGTRLAPRRKVHNGGVHCATA